MKATEQDKKNLIIGLTIAIIATVIIILAGALVANLTDKRNNKATNSDIDGDWNSTLTTYSYVFIPKSNINGLEFTFSIRDKNDKELQQIVKKVGDVKKGQQYTVTFTASEIKDFATIMNSSYTKLTVTGGTKKLI